MTFDTKVPQKLKKTQLWFGGIIGRPIDEDSRMNPISPIGQPMEVEACTYISPSPTLRPAQRIQIYNQQYWWRLLSSMHESFPFVTRLFGYHDFNRLISIPYLVKHPPRHWSLSLLGDRLAQWVKEEYHADDVNLVLDAVQLDNGYNDSFIAPQATPIALDTLPTSGDPESLLEQNLYLQPNVRLFEFRYDLMNFRQAFLKHDPEYWVENDFPPLKKDKKYYNVLFRNSAQDVVWREVSEAEYRLLELFKQGTTVEKACDWIETQQSSLLDEATQNLQRWFRDWIVYRWLTIEKSPCE
jgi:hypothetical protein